MKILVCDPISEEGLQLCIIIPNLKLTKYKSTEEELIQIVPEYHAIWSAVKLK